MASDAMSHRAALRRELETTPASDEAVVASVLAGETEHFELLMRRYNQRVYRTARAVLHDDREAEDAMQEAWVKAYSHLGSFGRRARFSTWLTRIVLNEAIQRSRSRRRAGELAVGIAQVQLAESSGSAEQDALDEEMRRALEKAITELPVVYRTTFVLREIEGLSVAETAECLDIAEETVKTRLHRARTQLRRHLETRFGSRLGGAFSFGFARCDRMVEGVFARIRELTP